MAAYETIDRGVAKVREQMGEGEGPTVCDASHVRNMNMNKEVATRLFRMLAVTEQTAATVKRDHASYARLHLLTQQMNLLQAQAQQTVEKSVAKAEASDELHLSESCTSLVSSEYDDGAKKLLAIMQVDNKTVSTIKKDAPACAKLSRLSEQAGMLQEQAQQAIRESEVNSHLFEIASRITCKLVPGTMYYHYTQNGDEVISRIADDEWSSYEEFHGKYLYDWDFTFRRQPAAGEAMEQDMAFVAPKLMLLPHVVATPPTTTDHEMMDAAPAVAPKPICGVLSRWS